MNTSARSLNSTPPHTVFILSAASLSITPSDVIEKCYKANRLKIVDGMMRVMGHGYTYTLHLLHVYSRLPILYFLRFILIGGV